ncbi:hypothetical protein [Micromonospora haikouensis]|uniref:hypothetical protein n=1 Tax=Micromonospora haikouensis TaxID=686309 RepID=UPI00114CA227|nr:hypothetical protein [Micromonospora haikouensis]
MQLSVQVKEAQGRRRRWKRAASDLLMPAMAVVGTTAVVRIQDGLDVQEWFIIGGTGLLTVLSLALVVIKARRERARAARRFQEAIKAALAVVKENRPESPSLEQEISDVSQTLTQTVTRLRDISVRAEAFETEVRTLVERAEAAQAVAQLSEDQANKISLLLSERTEQQLKDEIEKLKAANAEQAEQQRRSGTRLALWTFAGGVILGVLGNVLTNLIML